MTLIDNPFEGEPGFYACNLIADGVVALFEWGYDEAGAIYVYFLYDALSDNMYLCDENGNVYLSDVSRLNISSLETIPYFQDWANEVSKVFDEVSVEISVDLPLSVNSYCEIE